MSQFAYDSWKIIKYRELNRTDRRIDGDISLANDSSRRTLFVYFDGNEIDRVTYSRNVARYPLLKLDGKNLTVRFNEAGQGFRIVFETDYQKETFSKTMLKLTYISESPLKFAQNRISMPNDGFGSARYGSQPTRNLHDVMSQQQQHLPIHNPYSQPVGIEVDRYRAATVVNMFPESPQGSSFPSTPSFYGGSDLSPYSNFSQHSSSSRGFASPAPRKPLMVDESTQTMELAEAIKTGVVSLSDEMEKFTSNASFKGMLKMIVQQIKNNPDLQKLIDDTESASDVSQDPFEFLEQRPSAVQPKVVQRTSSFNPKSVSTPRGSRQSSRISRQVSERKTQPKGKTESSSVARRKSSKKIEKEYEYSSTRRTSARILAKRISSSSSATSDKPSTSTQRR